MAGPTLTAPTNASDDVSLTPALAWTALGGTGEYEVQVSRAATFLELDLQEFVASGPVDLADYVGAIGYPLDFGQTYYWRVRFKENGIAGDWSTTWSFTVMAAVLPYTPELDHKGEGQADMLQQFKGDA